MAVTVYFWPPGLENFGHAAVKIDAGAPPGDVYFSVWAKGELHPFWGPGVIMPYAADLKAENNRQPHTYRMTRLNETAMKEWIKKQDLHYSLIQNCSSNAAMCLRAGTPLANWLPVQSLTRISINTPWGLWLWVHNELWAYR